jgi:hypothetical protein
VPTVFPDLFAALSTPFDQQEVKVRSQAGRQFAYITARTAMNRLDAVLGPENWWDDFVPGENSVFCRLTVRLPDGSTLTKADAGGYAGMSDSGDDDKSGYSDAFKRAAVKFGVGRYLYRDGVPSYESNGSAPAPTQTPVADNVRKPEPTPSRPAPAINGIPIGFEPDGSIRKPNSGKGMFACCKEQQDKHQAEFIKPLNEWAKSNGMNGRMVDWDGEPLDRAWRYLCYLVAKHTGTLGTAPSSTPAPASNGNGDTASLRSSIIAKAGEVLQLVTGNPPTDVEIGVKLKGHWRELFDGAEMPKFGTIANSEQLNTLLGTLNTELVEANEWVPF